MQMRIKHIKYAPVEYNLGSFLLNSQLYTRHRIGLLAGHLAFQGGYLAFVEEKG